METCTITLTIQQRRALIAFLKAASVRGADVPAYVEILNLISAARPSRPAAEPQSPPAS
jgi:hypothetical protein